jgi:hypothetical protein
VIPLEVIYQAISNDTVIIGSAAPLGFAKQFDMICAKSDEINRLVFIFEVIAELFGCKKIQARPEVANCTPVTFKLFFEHFQNEFILDLKVFVQLSCRYVMSGVNVRSIF